MICESSGLGDEWEKIVRIQHMNTILVLAYSLYFRKFMFTSQVLDKCVVSDPVS